MSVSYYESIDEFLGARESRYFGRGYINTAQTISGFALDDAEDGTRFSGSGVVQLPGLWSAKGERKQKPHLSSIDAIEFAISCLSRVFAQLHPGQAFSLERLEKMSVLAGREPVEENLDAIALRGHVRQDAMGAGTLEMQISNMKVSLTFSAEPGPAGLVLGQEKQPLEIRDLMLHRDTLKASAIVAPERQNKAESWSLSSCFAAALQLGQVLLYKLDSLSRETSSTLWMRRISIDVSPGVPALDKPQPIYTRLDNVKKLHMAGTEWRCADISSILCNTHIVCSVAHRL